MAPIGKDDIHRGLIWFLVCTASLCVGISIGMLADHRAPKQHQDKVSAAVVYPPPPPAIAPVEAKPAATPTIQPEIPAQITAEIPAPPKIPAVINAQPKVEEPTLPNAAPHAAPIVHRSKHTTRRLLCLTPAMRLAFSDLESRFGVLEVIATCDHSTYVAGTNRVSHHVGGNAIDFLPGTKRKEILAYLVSTYRQGLVMTYSDSPHIHIDVGQRGVILTARDNALVGWSSASRRASADVGRHQRRVERDREDDDD